MSRKWALTAAVLAGLALPAPAVGVVTVWDDFSQGFSSSGSGARWFLSPDVKPFGIPAYTADDGITSTGQRRLQVRASGTNPATGQPAFTRTMAQEDDNAFGLPGQLDHDKWHAYMNHRSSSGQPGFDARPGEELTFEATISGRTFGTAGHPFGEAVDISPNDPRLAGVTLGARDFETHMSFEFLVTNDAVYALYARSPEGQTQQDDYAAFAFVVPLTNRAVGDSHRLAVAYDRRAGTVRWFVDGRERYRISRIGRLIDRRFMVIDHGGEERTVAPSQLVGGMGMITLLDAARPGEHALVRLSNLPFFYFNPATGRPNPQVFVDNSSFDASRIFGQGAAFAIGPYLVSTRGPVCRTPASLGLLASLGCDLLVALERRLAS